MSKDPKDLPIESLNEVADRLKRAETEIQRLRDRLKEFEKSIRDGTNPDPKEKNSRRRVSRQQYAM